MKTYKNLIFIVVFTFLIVLGINPIETYASSSSGGSSIVIILPSVIILAAILATIFAMISRKKHK